jgi:hypothetical protein
MPFQTTGKYDLAICDIDGCLSPESHAPINGPAISAIAEHNRQAFRTVIGQSSHCAVAGQLDLLSVFAV